MSVDLRILDAPADREEHISAAPIVTVRLDFDEHVAGQDALVFQVSASDVRGLIEDLTEVQDELASLEDRISDVRIPPWGRRAKAEGESDS